MNHKVFPIKTASACLLKWSHSTVFLTKATTASCHRVLQHKFDLDSFNFHNTPEKIVQRQKMLNGEWPGEGCEHCKSIEDAGGASDRILHLDFPGYRAPAELDTNPTAVNVSPRILEIYFSNVCNLKCTYCYPHFSSQINQENKKFGKFFKNGVRLGMERSASEEEYSKGSEKMFEWLDKNIHTLDKLLVLGGEPFIQKETNQLLDFLQDKNLPNLDLVIFSNLTIDPENFKKQVDKLASYSNNLHQINVIGSIDCWGEQAEYVRHGLNLQWFKENFEYMLYNTNFGLNINSTLGTLTIPSMPQLVDQINYWSKHRPVYWSLMKTAGHKYLHPTIFGSKIIDLGYQTAIDNFDTGQDIDKEKYKEYFQGIKSEIMQSQPDYQLQKQLKTYLTELDRRRNTDYTKTFPEIAELLKDIEI